MMGWTHSCTSIIKDITLVILSEIACPNSCSGLSQALAMFGKLFYGQWPHHEMLPLIRTEGEKMNKENNRIFVFFIVLFPDSNEFHFCMKHGRREVGMIVEAFFKNPFLLSIMFSKSNYLII